MRETLISTTHAHGGSPAYDTTDLVAEYRRRRAARRSVVTPPRPETRAGTGALGAAEPTAPLRPEAS